MKRCPECRRDYFDDSLLYCLDDGSALLEGPASGDEPATAVFGVPPSGSEFGVPPSGGVDDNERTRVFQEKLAEDNPQSAIRDPQSESGTQNTRAFDRRLLVAPILLVIIVLGGFFAYRYLTPASAGQINSIAVLPFQNRSGDPNAEYLSDGLAQSLIYRLSKLPNLQVSPTSSVNRYKGKETDVTAVASDLRVEAVMTGTLVQIGDNLTISVELVDARNNKLLWAEQYDRRMSDLLATQREIAGEIAGKLQLRLSGEGEQVLSKRYTDNNEAYQLYLKGRFHFAKRNRSDVERSLEYYKQAIELDPNFALAYSALADSYNGMTAYPYMAPKQAVPLAKA